ncbi:MAG: electron transport complex subunit E [Lachnospiraceae bacterium]|nr:electron transport complex subunit E [Lachnospiraceae bacterium]
MNKCVERLYNGVIKENPTLVLMLGMCPTLAVTTSAVNGLGMGLSTTVVLIMSNMIISALRKLIPEKVRMPAFIVVVASFVTIVDLLIQGFLPALNEALGIYIPLIVVNCIILGRAEAYASKNPVIPSIFDGMGMGLGFTVSLTIIGLIRELIGAGNAFGIRVLPESYEPFSIFVMAPGAFFVLALLTAIQNKLKLPSATNGDAPAYEPLACGGDCASCHGEKCVSNRELLERIADEQAALKASAKAVAKKAFPEGGAAVNIAAADAHNTKEAQAVVNTETKADDKPASNGKGGDKA